MKKTSKIIALLILGLMFVLMFCSSWNDSATFDEVAHIPAGYSYLTMQDYRLNPEHPPLIKDLSVLPLLFLKLNFPSDFNDQWRTGAAFLYESGNNPDQILHWARLPIMLLALVFGWMLFGWVSRQYGNKAGLLTLFFYSLSPLVIAHSRYVTTDLAAAFGFFIGLTSFLNFLNNPTKKNLIITGIIFGLVQMLKFSLIILAPLYVILAIIWAIINKVSVPKIIYKIILIGLIGLVVIAVVYQFHVWNYPVEKQAKSIRTILTSVGAKPFTNFLIWLSNTRVFQGLAQYFFGLLMTIQREMGGNSAYFLGTISSSGSYLYFPLLYLVKETPGFLILALIALIITLYHLLGNPISKWKLDFPIIASIIFVLVYFTQAITGNLNIGLRHILPILPFIYFLTAVGLARLKKFYVIIPLLFWILISTLITFPYYLSYYNFLGGGTWNGYKIATDSNYDWGQDLYRLVKFVDDNKIENIKLDYFGGGSPQYSLGNKFEPWWSTKGAPTSGWLAVSVNTFQGNKTYDWLKNKIPVVRAGTSIFIYKF